MEGIGKDFCQMILLQRNSGSESAVALLIRNLGETILDVSRDRVRAAGGRKVQEVGPDK